MTTEVKTQNLTIQKPPSKAGRKRVTMEDSYYIAKPLYKVTTGAYGTWGNKRFLNKSLAHFLIDADDETMQKIINYVNSLKTDEHKSG